MTGTARNQVELVLIDFQDGLEARVDVVGRALAEVNLGKAGAQEGGSRIEAGGFGNLGDDFGRDHASSSSSSTSYLASEAAGRPMMRASQGGGLNKAPCSSARMSRTGPPLGFFSGWTPARTTLAAAGPPIDWMKTRSQSAMTSARALFLSSAASASRPERTATSLIAVDET